MFAKILGFKTGLLFSGEIESIIPPQGKFDYWVVTPRKHPNQKRVRKLFFSKYIAYEVELIDREVIEDGTTGDTEVPDMLREHPN